MNMPPPETRVQRPAKDRYGREDDEHEAKIYVHLPKERIHMAKLYRNQIIKGIKRDKDKKLNQDLMIVKTDPRLKEQAQVEARIDVSPVHVAPQKLQYDRRRPSYVMEVVHHGSSGKGSRVQAEARALGTQIVMPPCVAVVPQRINKNNLIGLHRTKRNLKPFPGSPPPITTTRDPAFANQMKAAMNQTAITEERPLIAKISLHINQTESEAGEPKSVCRRKSPIKLNKAISVYAGSKQDSFDDSSNNELIRTAYQAPRTHNASQVRLEPPGPIHQSAVDLKPKLFINDR